MPFEPVRSGFTALENLGEAACRRCEEVATRTLSSQTDRWVQIPSAWPQLGSSLAVFYSGVARLGGDAPRA
jgi:hypothetical protein